ncbi:MAG: putative Polyubiquitin, partial [Streblomastix strix]
METPTLEEQNQTLNHLNVVFVGNEAFAGKKMTIQDNFEQKTIEYVIQKTMEFIGAATSELSFVAEYQTAMKFKVDKKGVQGDDLNKGIEALTGFMSSGLSCCVERSMPVGVVRIQMKEKEGQYFDIPFGKQETILDLKKKILPLISQDYTIEEIMLKLDDCILLNDKTAEQINIQGGEEFILQRDISLRLQIHTQQNKIIEIELEKTDTISAIKQKIEEKENFPSDHQRLIYQGKQLEDSKTIQECALPEKAILKLTIRLPNGILISIKKPSGKIIQLDIEKSSKIEQLKQKIEDLEDVPTEKQWLIYNSHELEDQHTIEEYNIPEESVIHLSVKRHMDSMLVFFESVSGKTVGLEVQNEDTMDSIRSRIEKQEGIRINQQIQHQFEGQKIDSKKKISDYKISQGSQLHLIQQHHPLGRINITLPKGKSIYLSVELSSTISDIKKKIEQSENYQQKDQYLTFNEIKLEDNRTLQDYKIKFRDTICLQLIPLGNVNIIIRTQKQKMIELEFAKTELVEDVKLKIEEIESIPTEQQFLIFNNHLLEDGMRLYNYNIQEQSVVQLEVKQQESGMLIFVETSKGKIYSLEVQCSDSITSIRKRIEVIEGTISETEYQQQTERESESKKNNNNNNKTLQDYNIQQGSTLHLDYQCKPLGKINIGLPKEKQISFVVEISDSVISVKKKIQEETGIQEKQQCLSFQEQELENEKQLSEYNVKFNDTLKLTVLPAGVIQIFVKIPNGKTLPFEIDSDDTVDNLKLNIQEKTKIFSDKQRLVISGKQLEDGHTISEYDIKHGSTVDLELRLPGGVGPTPSKQFVNVTGNQTLKVIRSDSTAAKWRQAEAGLSIEGLCQNEQCEAFGKMVIFKAGFTDFDSISDEATCPICQ